ncbi:S8 family peptidase [Clostridium tarantellae]|uniref:S8 family serine peptidase n=1 Tax=Clostridium tarantellae TaxID=39493 RepID=A0A6I1MKA1_9CLOT|nr:S8 family peptidase [Clostridium tarantellae]MPQ43450.1 S8 family serine peptidase [Clostridium tarantellae]
MANNFYNDDNFDKFLIEYSGDILKEVGDNPDASVYIIDELYAILSIRIEKFEELITKLKTVVYVESDGVYTLTGINVVDKSKASNFHGNPYLDLRGKGVVVGVIDTGIDYLNEEFVLEDDSTRIIEIWDQTIQSSQKNDLISGTLYTREEINEAIKLKNNGEDPYTIVPSKDEIGHGTAMAGIIGGRGKNKQLTGAAPDCEFIVVKLKETFDSLKEYYGTKDIKIPQYASMDIMIAIKYLYEKSFELDVPMVIYVPLGSNTGVHEGSNLLDIYMSYLVEKRGFIIVTSTGNQGDSATHISGVIEMNEYSNEFELNIGKDQQSIYMVMYIKVPNKVDLTVISPSGEIIDINTKLKFTPLLFTGVQAKFVYEGTLMDIVFYWPSIQNGDQSIVFRASNLKEGIWKFRIGGKHNVPIVYEARILQKELLYEGTFFLKPDPNNTITIPGMADEILTVGWYNQTNNALVAQSGRGGEICQAVKPSITAGGVNCITTKSGGGTTIVSGGSVAAAVVAGCCALLLQWGIIDENDDYMYSTTVRTYLKAGAARRGDDVYPNNKLGFGILDLEGVFNNIRENLGNTNIRKNLEKSLDKGYRIGSLVIKNPYV